MQKCLDCKNIFDDEDIVCPYCQSDNSEQIEEEPEDKFEAYKEWKWDSRCR